MNGPLTQSVLDFEATVGRLVRTARTPADWAPLAELVATEDFERVGTWLEVMNWPQYTEFMTRWATSSLGFATTVRRVSELPGLVYLELEERHTRPDTVAVVNSLSVFAFNQEGRIHHLDVYLQQPRQAQASTTSRSAGTRLLT